jgi:hypothetical protein
MEHADGLALILMLAFSAAVLVCLWRARRGRVPYIRRIPGIASLEEAMGRATELGRPVIFALGHSGLQAIETHSALAILAYVARLAARLRTPFIALVSQQDVYPVAEETVRQAYTAEGVPDQFKAEDQVRFLSGHTTIFAMGAARLIEETKAGCALFFGPFDFTSLLMAEPGARMGVMQIAGDPSLFQIPFFVCTCDYTVIGEEYFAAGAYLSTEPQARATLASQDIIKATVAGMILVGTVLYQFYGSWPKWLHGLLTALKITEPRP